MWFVPDNHRKGDFEIDKTFTILLAIIGLAVVAYLLISLFGNATGLYESLFKGG